ncbi:MAG: AAA family ATPase, partial [Phormidesmis sp.]
MHVKRVELSNFKSFGGATDVPLLPGFTVISGPNGSGKSNILDSLLFCLGLASSRGMRAERLPDLVNQNQAKRRSTVETIVTATFDITDVADKLLSNEEDEDETSEDTDSATLTESELESTELEPVGLEPTEPALEGPTAAGEDEGKGGDKDNSEDSRNGHHQSANSLNGTLSNLNGNSSLNGNANGSLNEKSSLPIEWKVTRRLRVTAQGTYTSNYYINDEPCTLNDLHEQLQRFRIYPEGYNVVLQGDVTSIISMNARERREIIDELAGVASFDRKINQAKAKLDVVKEREERFRIVETELTAQLARLDQDRKKAEKYKQLKATLQEKQRWEGVMQWRSHQKQAEQLQGKITQGHREAESLSANITALSEQMENTAAALAVLNAKVKALGEEEYLSLQAQLATQEAELRQLVRQEENLSHATRELSTQLTETQTRIRAQEGELVGVSAALKSLTDDELTKLTTARDRAAAELEAKREETAAIAGKSQAWVQQQTDLRHQVETLLNQLEPQRAESVRLQERESQLEAQMNSQRAALAELEQEMS